MAKQKATFEKRAREKAKQDKRLEKIDRKSNKNKASDDSDAGQENTFDGDPDLAGIVPGPQPIVE